MNEYKENKFIKIENTNTIFMTNFSGDPERDKYGSPYRQVNIILPDDLAVDMLSQGFNVKATRPKPGEEEGFIPTHFVKCILRYRNSIGNKTKNQPKVYKVIEGHDPILLTEETVGQLDNITIKNVDIVIKGWYYEESDQWCCDVQTMYVEQDMTMDDPFYNKWNSESIDVDQPPFDEDM